LKNNHKGAELLPVGAKKKNYEGQNAPRVRVFLRAFVVFSSHP
jgi:hypothetical protein